MKFDTLRRRLGTLKFCTILVEPEEATLFTFTKFVTVDRRHTSATDIIEDISDQNAVAWDVRIDPDHSGFNGPQPPEPLFLCIRIDPCVP